MRSVPSRGGYLAVTFGLAAAGSVAAAWFGWGDTGAVAAGALAAWAIQAVAYWKLVAALDEGRSATRPWVLGMGARFGGLVLAAVAARYAPEGGTEVLLAFGTAILVFLLLEAGWLARRPPAWPPVPTREPTGMDGESPRARAGSEGPKGRPETSRQVDG